MTKEELCHELNCYLERQIGNYAIGDLDNIVDEFFNANVVIPKGENRHPDADVLHAIIENPFLKVETDQWALQWKEPESYYITNGIVNSKALIRYRIKPSEPVYEWQFVYIKADNTAGITCFYTDEESKDCYQFTKIQETKRERK